MDFSLSDEQRRIQESFAVFAIDEIAPIRDQLESDVGLRRALYQKMARRGFGVLMVAKNLGGAGLDAMSFALALGAIAKVDAGVAVALSVTNLVADAIASYGTKDQMERYVRKLASGEIASACFAMTELNAGSDPKSMDSKAEVIDKGYRIVGAKQFITNGDLADVCLVFAKVGTDAITAFLVDRALPGWGVAKVEAKMGLLTVNLVDLTFEGCEVGPRQRLGEEGDGLRIGLGMLDRGRLSIASQALGIAEAAYEAALDRSRSRQQFQHPIADFQGIAFKLADMRVKLDAAKLLLYRAAWLHDRGDPFTLEASMAKLFASESANEIVSDALQIFGGYGYVKDYPLERYYRDVRVTTIYEGTSEIQRVVISRNLVNLLR